MNGHSSLFIRVLLLSSLLFPKLSVSGCSLSLLFLFLFLLLGVCVLEWPDGDWLFSHWLVSGDPLLVLFLFLLLGVGIREWFEGDVSELLDCSRDWVFACSFEELFGDWN